MNPLAIQATFMADIPSVGIAEHTFLHVFGIIFSKCKERWGDIGCAYHDDSVGVVGAADDGLLSPPESPKPPQSLH